MKIDLIVLFSLIKF